MERLRSLAAEVAARTGPLASRVMGRHVVQATGSLDTGLLAALRAHLDDDDMVFAISLGSPKTNRKPVIQMISSAGEEVGYAKVGWSDHTVGLVLNEAAWLRRAPGEAPLRPRLLDEVELCGHTVVVTTALRGGRLPRRRVTSCPLDLVRDVSRLRGGSNPDTGPVPLEELPWARRVRSLWPNMADDEQQAVSQIFNRHGATLFTRAPWHGDLAPWNVLSTARGSGLIDWEFAADGVPMGFDACHFHTQVGMEILGLDASSALDRSRAASASSLGDLGLDPDVATATQDLYGIELIRRTIELRAAGFDVGNVTQGPAALRSILDGNR